MAVLKCKMCGGELNASGNASVVECEFCGTRQTIPTSKDENLQGLFNRANILRMKSEFDKAAEIYEKIIQKDETQAEAYWGIILCKYGIEYVEDPQSFKRIPTCHRTSFDSIIADEDYKSALSYADSVQREIYESEAKEIDKLQKDILSIVHKEDPFDVFICYKETDADGKRTQDSVIANDIYHQLTQEGFKVFYAAITLENKLGTAYEPYIFAALNSAKVMLVIGTKPEYFNAVWVKNEWSRFLKLIPKDRTKLLIPCYRDMDAYELPEEFAHLQAQDMSKIGFINDVVRGIKKVINPDEQNREVVKETAAQSINANIEPLLKRAFMFLEDGDWNSANEYCEKVLDTDPENAEAYLGKLMSDCTKHNRDELLSYSPSEDTMCKIQNNKNFVNAFRYATQEFKQAFLDKLMYTIAENIEKSAETAEDFFEASLCYKQIKNYEDAAMRFKECDKKYKSIQRLREDFWKAYEQFEQEYDKIDNQRYEKSLELRTELIKNNKKKLADELNQSVQTLNAEIDKQKKIKDDENAMLGQLGFFQFQQKKEHQLAIQKIESKISQLHADIQSEEMQYEQKLNNIEKTIDMDRINRQVNKNFPLPVRPQIDKSLYYSEKECIKLLIEKSVLELWKLYTWEELDAEFFGAVETGFPAFVGRNEKFVKRVYRTVKMCCNKEKDKGKVFLQLNEEKIKNL